MTIQQIEVASAQGSRSQAVHHSIRRRPAPYFYEKTLETMVYMCTASRRYLREHQVLCKTANELLGSNRSSAISRT